MVNLSDALAKAQTHLQKLVNGDGEGWSDQRE